MKVKLPALPVWKPVLLLLVIAACSFTLKVKLCVAAIPTLLLAVMVTMLTPPLPVKGVPEISPVFAFSNRPFGNAPLVMLNVGAGKPVAVTVKVPAVPTVKVALATLVIVGACPTVSAKFCVASGLRPLVAVTVKLNTPLLPMAGVPLSKPWLLNVTPCGRVPLVTLKLGAGNPLAVKLKLPEVPATKPALAGLVKAGAPPILMVKFCVVEPAPLVACRVTVYTPPAAVGLPLNTPVVLSRFRPAGRVLLFEERP